MIKSFYVLIAALFLSFLISCGGKEKKKETKKNTPIEEVDTSNVDTLVEEEVVKYRFIEDFANLKERLAEHKIKYIDEPYVRFEGTELEQETMFIADPYGNAMEIKTMKNPDTLWKTNK